MKTFLFSLFFLTYFSVSSQTSPHIQGKVFVDMNTGLFQCDVTISNISSLDDYKILLNKGMNIKAFRDVDGKSIAYDGFYDGKLKGEAMQYILGNEKGEMYLPNTFKVVYVGAFPKYDNSYNMFDFKGFIAINDKTIRATEQTKWYPVIYDVQKDKLINSYTYNLEIEVVGGKSIFINGSAPKETSKANFSSKKAVPLLLFAGGYEFVSEKGNYILNGGISKQTATEVFKNVNTVQSFLEEKLDRKFVDNIYLIQHKAVNKRRKGSSWGFNTYPTFAFAGENYFGSIVTDEGTFNNENFRYFCHEFGHNYFGNNVQSGNLYWFWLESFPEYLSFTFAQEISGEAFFKEVIQSKLKAVTKEEYVPLSKITEPNQISGSYRYNMAPLVLLSFDYHFGREKTFEVIRRILEMAKKETLSLDYFKQAAIESGISTTLYEKFEETYISNVSFKENTIKYLKKKLE